LCCSLLCFFALFFCVVPCFAFLYYLFALLVCRFVTLSVCCVANVVGFAGLLHCFWCCWFIALLLLLLVCHHFCYYWCVMLLVLCVAYFVVGHVVNS
jgi:hypothetical protein